MRRSAIVEEIREIRLIRCIKQINTVVENIVCQVTNYKEFKQQSSYGENN